MTEVRGHSLGTRTSRGMLWAYGSYVGGRLLVLISTAILARLLDPTDFGLVALALIFTALLESVSDLGVGQALVVFRGDEERVLEQAETAFVFSVVLGAGLTAVTAALSPLAALFFDQPELVGLLAVLGTNFLLRSLGATHYALSQKRLDFRARTVAEMADVVVRGLTGIALALAGTGAWSLVIGYIVGTATLSAAMWLMVPWRPRLRPRRAHVRQLVGFGGTISAVSALGAVIANVDYVFIGRVLGAASLGLYTLGFRLPELIVINLSVVAGQVLFPAFAAVERAALGHAFLVSLRYTLMVAVPCSALLVGLAEPLTLAAFGERWRDSIAPMQVLTIYALGVAIGIPAGSAYKATGRAGVLLKLAVPRAALLVAAIAVFVDHGIVAVAACQAVVAALFAAVGIALASRLLDVGVRRLWSVAWPSLGGAAAMLAVMLPLESAISSPWLALLLAGASAGATYVGALWLIDRASIVRLHELVFAPAPASPAAGASGGEEAGVTMDARARVGQPPPRKAP
jgi:O-antigen/teichoic acid export membrane protein